MSSETEPSISHRDDIFAMLSASGYHRARVTCLSDFNRIVGGIAWALVRFDDVSVAANLLYEETEDQNIRLRTEQSEKVIEALEAVQCPHEISAHQLLGLDFANIKNVIRWLLRHVVAQDTKQGKNEFFTEWFTMGHNNEEEAIAEYKKRLRRPGSNRSSTTRHMKRFENTMIFDLAIDAKCTLAEYVIYSRHGKRVYKSEEDRIALIEEANLQEASANKHVSTKALIDMMENAVVEVFQERTNKLISACGEVCQKLDEFNVPERLSNLEARLADEAASFLNAQRDHELLKKKYEEVVSTVASVSELEAQQMAEVMKMYRTVQDRARDLRIFVTEDLNAARKKETKMRRNVDDQGNIQEYDAHKRELMEEQAAKAAEFAISVRDVLALQYRLDRILQVAVTSHYRKRHMEKFDESADINQQMKAAVIDFNITIDILTFSAKITGFMNQLEKNLVAHPASQEYRDAFVSYMNDVRTQLGEYHWKAKLTQDNTITEKQTLAALRAAIRSKEREVTYSSMEMKKLLYMNQNLQQMSDTMTAIEGKSISYAEKKATVQE